jgi:hypothetical protein
MQTTQPCLVAVVSKFLWQYEAIPTWPTLHASNDIYPTVEQNKCLYSADYRGGLLFSSVAVFWCSTTTTSPSSYYFSAFCERCNVIASTARFEKDRTIVSCCRKIEVAVPQNIKGQHASPRDWSTSPRRPTTDTPRDQRRSHSARSDSFSSANSADESTEDTTEHEQQIIG